ncbi:hypothetical protein [Acinetobacter indicus]|nr:hypothetical protein [Acinetobacter indicus]
MQQSHWIVVSQQPTDDLLAQANTLILKVSVGIFVNGILKLTPFTLQMAK